MFKINVPWSGWGSHVSEFEDATDAAQELRRLMTTQAFNAKEDGKARYILVRIGPEKIIHEDGTFTNTDAVHHMQKFLRTL